MRRKPARLDEVSRRVEWPDPLQSLPSPALFLLPDGLSKTFIPGGHTYSPDNDPLPELNSEQDNVNLNADLIQSEINRQQRERKLLDSQFQRFIRTRTIPQGRRFFARLLILRLSGY